MDTTRPSKLPPSDWVARCIQQIRLIDPGLTEDGTSVNVHFRISAGTRGLGDHIIIVGNRRPNAQVIQRDESIV